jgi:hypothetical protein
MTPDTRKLKKYLPRIEQLFGIDQVLDAAHQLITFAMLELHELALADTDAVLAGADEAYDWTGRLKSVLNSQKWIKMQSGLH